MAGHQSLRLLEADLLRPPRTATSSVAYCAPPKVLIVNNAALTLYPQNKTVEFELDAGSTANDVNVTVAIHVDAYGLGVIDFSLDLCTIAGGILCPLPTYQFNGGGVYPIPQEYIDQIPSIAYTIPDLEALATLSLTSQTGEVVGCVQVTLTNGHTAKQSGALWATVGLALLALFSSLLHSSIAQSVGAAQWRVVDVFMMIQHIAITGLLSLNFPIVFVSYAVNFAWSIGIVNIPSLQRSITSTREATGGSDSPGVFGKQLTAQTARNAVKLVELLNPAAANSGGSISLIKTQGDTLSSASAAGPAALSASSSHFSASQSHLSARAAQYAPNTGPDGLPLTSGTSANLPIVSNTTESEYGGLDLFVQRANVAPGNALMTVIVSIFILLAIVVGALLLTYGIAWLFRLVTSRRSTGNAAHWSRRLTRPSEFGIVVLATMARFTLVVLPILFIFAFYQWDHGDGSWVPHFLAAIFLAFFLLVLAFFFVPCFYHASRSVLGAQVLYYGKDEAPLEGTTPAKRWGHVAHPYRPKYWWFALIFLLMSIIRACFVSFAQGKDFTQAVGLLVFEVVFFILLIALRVGRDKKSDWVFIVLTFFRFASWAVCVALTRRANVTTIPRAIVGFVLIVVTGLPIIWLFFLTVWDLFSALLPKKRRPNRHPYLDREKGDGVDGEKAAAAAAAGTGAGAGAAAAAHHSPTSEHTSDGGAAPALGPVGSGSSPSATSTSAEDPAIARGEANSPNSNPYGPADDYWSRQH